MARTRVFTANNVVAPAAPPSYELPDKNGVSIPAGKTSWTLSIDTTGLPQHAPLGDFAIEYLIGGNWTEISEDFGALTGPYKGGSMLWTSSCTLALSPYPTAARIRVDACPGYTFPSVTLDLF